MKHWQAPLPLLALILLSVFAPSCSPTYPKERLAESLVELCQREYDIPVKAKFAQTTLGVLVEIPGLVEEFRRRAALAGIPAAEILEVEGQVRGEAMDFAFVTKGPLVQVDQKPKETDRGDREEEDSEAMKRLRHVSLALNRVGLSTDAHLQFYQLIARDPGPDHLDVIFSGHIHDSKRVQSQLISLGDLQYRSEAQARIQPEYLAQYTVASFLQDLKDKSLSHLLARYAAASDQIPALLPKLLAVVADLQGRQDRLLAQEETWGLRQIEPSQALVYVPLTPIGDPGALLFTVRWEGNRGALEEIERLETSVLPARYRKWGQPQDWESALYIEPLAMPQFLVDQIRRRVLAQFEPILLEEAPPAGGTLPDKSFHEETAENEEAPRKPRRSAASSQPANAHDVTQALAQTAAYVTYSYRFSDFNEISITDAALGTQWVIPALELPLYRRRNPPDLQPIP